MLGRNSDPPPPRRPQPTSIFGGLASQLRVLRGCPERRRVLQLLIDGFGKQNQSSGPSHGRCSGPPAAQAQPKGRAGSGVGSGKPYCLAPAKWSGHHMIFRGRRTMHLRTGLRRPYCPGHDGHCSAHGRVPECCAGWRAVHTPHALPSTGRRPCEPQNACGGVCNADGAMKRTLFAQIFRPGRHFQLSTLLLQGLRRRSSCCGLPAQRIRSDPLISKYTKKKYGKKPCFMWVIPLLTCLNDPPLQFSWNRSACFSRPLHVTPSTKTFVAYYKMGNRHGN